MQEATRRTGSSGMNEQKRILRFVGIARALPCPSPNRPYVACAKTRSGSKVGGPGPLFQAAKIKGIKWYCSDPVPHKLVLGGHLSAV